MVCYVTNSHPCDVSSRNSRLWRTVGSNPLVVGGNKNLSRDYRLRPKAEGIAIFIVLFPRLSWQKKGVYGKEHCINIWVYIYYLLYIHPQFVVYDFFHLHGMILTSPNGWYLGVIAWFGTWLVLATCPAIVDALLFFDQSITNYFGVFQGIQIFHP